MKHKSAKESSASAGPSRLRTGRRSRQRQEKEAGDSLSLLRPVYPGSTLLPLNDSLNHLVRRTDKTILVHLALNWIHRAEAGCDPDILPPTLAGHEEEVPMHVDEQVTEEEAAEYRYEKARLELIARKRATSHDELRLVYCAVSSRKAEVIERILHIDWPSGITFAMAAMIHFENIRALPLSRSWTAMYLDYGNDMWAEDKEGHVRNKRAYEKVTAQQLKEEFSSELKNFCSHSMFIDQPARRLPIRSKMYDDLAPLSDDWTRSFVHIRVVSCSSTTSLCAKGWHFLHLPGTPWFLVSGPLNKSEVMGQLSVAALAHSLGAHRMRTSTRSESMIVSMGRLGELKGRDACALRELIVSTHDVEDKGQTASIQAGGKGRDMRRNVAEDGPLVAAEVRERVDKTGLYEEIARREEGNVGPIATGVLHEQTVGLVHPAERLWLLRQKRAKRYRQSRRVEESFGRSEAEGKSEADLPRLQQVTYSLHMPLGREMDAGDNGSDGQDSHVIQLRLYGNHVLAGLRIFAERGLDQERVATDAERPSGLPSWLVDVRGTKISVGKEAEPEPGLRDQSRGSSSDRDVIE